MRKIIIIVDTEDVEIGDEIIGMPGNKWRIRREIPSRIAVQNAHLYQTLAMAEEIKDGGYSSQILETKAEQFAQHFLSLDEHLRAGGNLPLTWCSGIDEQGSWTRPANIIRPTGGYGAVGDDTPPGCV